MKKLLIITAGMLFGMAAYAQQPESVKKSTSTTPASATAVTASPAIEVIEPIKADTKKTESKASCDDTKDQKACGTTTSGKKSCCSSKSSAKKEGN